MLKLTQSKVLTHDEAPLLPEQWMMPLDGTCATSELLNRLVQVNLPGGEESSETAQRRISRAQSASPERPVSSRSVSPPGGPSAPANQWAGWRGQSADNGNDSESAAKRPDTAVQTGAPVFAPTPGVSTSRGHREGESKFSTPIVPPNVTSSLPPLLSSPRVGAPPFPVAAATVRQGAREETMSPTDDLDALAAKIELILDEQARRHGIDV